MADLWNNALVEPTWLTTNPPLKVNVPAKTYGLVLGILAVLGAIGALIATIAAFTFSATIGSLATSVCNYDHSIGLSPAGCNLATGSSIAGLGELVVLVAMVLGAWGGFQMYQGVHRGRALLAYAMALAVVGQLVYLILWGIGAAIAFFIVYLIVYAVIYYFLVISRFPDEAPLVPAAATPAGYPPYGPPPNYPQPPQGPYPPQGPPQS
ncbi:MAG: hypothetical protein WB802_00560 [Candidatus Dormiibacterota bacterium]|jgi:hypothetical protein